MSRIASSVSRSGAAALLAALAMALAGCFTISQAEYPLVETVPAPAGTATRVAISGFSAMFTTYTPVYGYATVWRREPGYYRHGRYHHGVDYPETVTTTTYVPRTDETKDYAEMAQDALEGAGFIVSADNAAYRVDVKFSGPVTCGADTAWEALTMICSLLTADYTAETWTARLKITDNSSGRVVLMKTYEQRYHAAVWGLVPLFSPLAADEVGGNYIKRWCLAALTERTAADATAFLASVSKEDGK